MMMPKPKLHVETNAFDKYKTKCTQDRTWPQNYNIKSQHKTWERGERISKWTKIREKKKNVIASVKTFTGRTKSLQVFTCPIAVYWERWIRDEGSVMWRKANRVVGDKKLPQNSLKKNHLKGDIKLFNLGERLFLTWGKKLICRVLGSDIFHSVHFGYLEPQDTEMQWLAENSST